MALNSAQPQWLGQAASSPEMLDLTPESTLMLAPHSCLALISI